MPDSTNELKGHASRSPDNDAQRRHLLNDGDHTIVGPESMIGRLRSDIADALQRVSDRITRV